MSSHLYYLKAGDEDYEKVDHAMHQEKLPEENRRMRILKEPAMRRRLRHRSRSLVEGEEEEERHRSRRHDGVAAMRATSSRR